MEALLLNSGNKVLLNMEKVDSKQNTIVTNFEYVKFLKDNIRLNISKLNDRVICLAHLSQKIYFLHY